MLANSAAAWERTAARADSTAAGVAGRCRRSDASAALYTLVKLAAAAFVRFLMLVQRHCLRRDGVRKFNEGRRVHAHVFNGRTDGQQKDGSRQHEVRRASHLDDRKRGGVIVHVLAIRDDDDVGFKHDAVFGGRQKGVRCREERRSLLSGREGSDVVHVDGRACRAKAVKNGSRGCGLHGCHAFAGQFRPDASHRAAVVDASRAVHSGSNEVGSCTNIRSLVTETLICSSILFLSPDFERKCYKKNICVVFICKDFAVQDYEKNCYGDIYIVLHLASVVFLRNAYDDQSDRTKISYCPRNTLSEI